MHEESLKFAPAIEEALYLLANQVKSLRGNSQSLEDINSFTVEVTRQLDIHEGIILESLGDGASLQLNLQGQCLSLNLDTVLKLLKGFLAKYLKNLREYG